ncbi:MAG: hypothetical protein ACLTBU_09885 [Zhenhengia sp.]|uniref:hypothetical protein n=1 Tax=Zhenhengia sp. TaxID=2944208 RepID=UPI003991010F
MTRIYKSLILAQLNNYSSREKMLAYYICYVRVVLPWEDTVYIATQNKELFAEFVKGLGAVDASYLEELFKDYDICVAEGDACGEVALCIKSNAKGFLELAVSTVDISNFDIQIAPVYVVVEKINKLFNALKEGKTLINYKTPAGIQGLHTSLNWLDIDVWGQGVAGSEWRQIVQLSNRYGDIGQVILPNLNQPCPTYEHINVLDILKVELLEE